MGYDSKLFHLRFKGRSRHAQDRGRALSVRYSQPACIDPERVTLTKNHRALDHVLQFAHIARPGIAVKEVQRLFTDAAKSLSGFLRVALDQIFHQQRNVTGSVTQSW